MKILEDFIEASAKIADQAAKVAGEAFEQSKVLAGEAVDMGKRKMNILALENDLAKAQRQLGALYYVMRKTGEENEDLMTQYYEDVVRINDQLEKLKAEDRSAAEDVCEEECSDVCDEAPREECGEICADVPVENEEKNDTENL